MTYLAFVALSAPFILYAPPGKTPPRIEATIEKGPILEMIVRCSAGTAIISYSKIERLYCGPRGGCERSAAPVVQRVCR